MLPLFFDKLGFWILSLFVLSAAVTASILFWPAEVSLAPLWYPLLFLPRWWALVLFLGVLPFLLRSGIRTRLFVLSLAVVQVFTYGGLRLNFSHISEARDAVKVASFNLGSRYLEAEKFKVWLEYESIDLVLFQEAVREDPLERAIPSGWTLLREDQMAIATRFPAQLTRSEKRSELSGGYGLVFLGALVQARGQALKVFNVHLETPRDGIEPFTHGRWDVDAIKRNYRIREHEASLVAAEIEQANIIAGDFNMPVESPLYRKFFAKSANAFDQCGNGFGWTKRMRLHGIRIDHILASSELISVNCFIGSNFGSDHLPIVTTLLLPNSSQ